MGILKALEKRKEIMTEMIIRSVINEGEPVKYRGIVAKLVDMTFDEISCVAALVNQALDSNEAPPTEVISLFLYYLGLYIDIRGEEET